MPKEFNQATHLLDDHDLEEITRHIKDHYCTSGKLNNDEGKNIYWELKVNVWKD